MTRILLFAMLAAGLLASSPSPAQAITQEQKTMLDQLDLLDRQEFIAQVEKAQACISSRDFACAEKRLAKAAKFVTDSQDKKALQLAKNDLAAERQRAVEEELQRREEERRRAEEERRRAEEERQRAERLEQERWQAERDALEEEADRGPTTAEMIKIAGDQFLQSYANELEKSRAAKMQAYEWARQREAEVKAENARRQAEFARRSAQLESERMARERSAAAQRNESERQAVAEARRLEEQRNAELRRQQEAQRQKEQRQKEQQERERRLEEERRKQEERRRQEAEKLAKQQEEERARADYLLKMRSGIRLGARNCYGETHVGGTRPAGKEVVGCIDVAFTAYCPGANGGTSGLLKTFTGFDAGCFGDTTRIEKPSCNPRELRIVVDEVRECR